MQTDTADIQTLCDAFEAARAVRPHTAESQAAARDAWAALNAAHIAAHGPRKVSGYASRAGQRQQAMMRAKAGR